MVHYPSLVALLKLCVKKVKHGNLSSGQAYNMEMRQRKIHSPDEFKSVVEDGGENRSDAPIIEATKDDPATVKTDNSNSSHTAEDAVIVAAVRGGSLLMLLALIQRASTFVLNILLQRAMLADDGHRVTNGGVGAGRRTSAFEDYGAAAITLELISSTTLFLAREPFRVALARSRAPLESKPQCHGPSNAAAVAAGADRQEAYRQRLVNTAWLSAPVGVAFAAVVHLAYPMLLTNEDFHGVKENRQAATLVCIAAALELLCEPLVLIFQYQLLVGVRVRAEAAAVLVLGVSRYLLATQADMGMLSFGCAQLLHSVTLATVYCFSAARQISKSTRLLAPSPPATTTTRGKGTFIGSRGFSHVRGWLPGRPRSPAVIGTNTPVSTAGSSSPSSPSLQKGVATGEGWVDYEQLRLVGALAGQSVLKHVLTEGDKIVLARASTVHVAQGDGTGGSLYEQGVYAIASGYGSLVARLLFQPLEESARLLFSKLGAEENEKNPDDGTWTPAKQLAGNQLGEYQITNDSSGASEKSRGADAGDATSQVLECEAGSGLRSRMAELLGTLLKLVLTAGLVFVCFGFHYTETLLRLLLAGRNGARSKGSSTVAKVAPVLSWYCVYVLFLAANGMCEAFACAVARGGQLTGMGGGLLASFLVFWTLVAPLTSRFGTRGLVMANAAGMACRVICSAAFIRRYFLWVTKSERSRRNLGRASGDENSGGSPPTATQKRAPMNTSLWNKVLIGALPHPAVILAMVVSSAAAYMSSPYHPVVAARGQTDELPWDMVAAAKHVGVGAAGFVFSAALFTIFETRFLRELRALWGARRKRQQEEAPEGGLSTARAGNPTYGPPAVTRMAGNLKHYKAD